ncbi:hypothetical protein JTB14_036598 [Gonioctena quinquepunctata]|nr:hypothetical protein JTB14_036598 [Gonioctena quinquepunctata]
MGEYCKGCEKSVNDNEERVMCDSCKDVFHSTKEKNCSGMTTTEYRAVMLQKRSTLFFCFECKEAFKNVPMLLRQIMESKNQVEDLKKEVEDMKSEIKMIKETKATSLEEEKERKEKNVIVLNIEEPKEK